MTTKVTKKSSVKGALDIDVGEDTRAVAKKTSTRVAKPEPKSEIDIAAAAFDSILDGIENDCGVTLTEGNRSTTRESTGLINLDLILEGGLTTGGWYTFFGGEQSSKSTLAQTQLAMAAVTKHTPILLYFDFEGSFSPDYMLSIARSMGFTGDLTDLFGIQDPKTGKYIKRPLIRKYQENVAEKFFDYVAKLERILPDKLWKHDKWWKVYDDNKKMPGYKQLKEACDKTLYKRTGRLWVECEDGHPQALIVVDSYPAMLPENLDVDDPKSGLGAQARMFSEQLKRVKGKMAPKRITIMGVNQLRLRPMTMMGNPEYEPGGEALKFFSDVRIKMTARAVPTGGGQFEEEDGIGGGTDVYRYIHMRAHKNKLSVPNLEGWARIWVRDANGVAHGYDPVYDCFEAMKRTGLISGTKNRLKIALPQMEKQRKGLTWGQFKTLIIGTKTEIKETLQEVGVDKPFYLRKELFKLMQSGELTRRMFDAMRGEAEEEDEEDEDDDD